MRGVLCHGSFTITSSPFSAAYNRGVQTYLLPCYTSRLEILFIINAIVTAIEVLFHSGKNTLYKLFSRLCSACARVLLDKESLTSSSAASLGAILGFDV